MVDPLLASFDFTGICNRYIDGNGYSLRIISRLGTVVVVLMSCAIRSASAPDLKLHGSSISQKEVGPERAFRKLLKTDWIGSIISKIQLNCGYSSFPPPTRTCFYLIP